MTDRNQGQGEGDQMSQETEPQCGGPSESCLIIGCPECNMTEEKLRAMVCKLGDRADNMEIERDDLRAQVDALRGERDKERARADSWVKHVTEAVASIAHDIGAFDSAASAEDYYRDSSSRSLRELVWYARRAIETHAELQSANKRITESEAERDQALARVGEVERHLSDIDDALDDESDDTAAVAVRRLIRGRDDLRQECVESCGALAEMEHQRDAALAKLAGAEGRVGEMTEGMRVLHNLCKRTAKEYDQIGNADAAGKLLGVAKCLRDIAGEAVDDAALGRGEGTSPAPIGIPP